MSFVLPETFSRAVSVLSPGRLSAPDGARVAESGSGRRVEMSAGPARAAPPPQRIQGGTADHAAAAVRQGGVPFASHSRSWGFLMSLQEPVLGDCFSRGRPACSGAGVCVDAAVSLFFCTLADGGTA